LKFSVTLLESQVEVTKKETRRSHPESSQQLN